ncbi:hypothetical protein ACJX0J_020633, partial [Zea mays]
CFLLMYGHLQKSINLYLVLVVATMQFSLLQRSIFVREFVLSGHFVGFIIALCLSHVLFAMVGIGCCHLLWMMCLHIGLKYVVIGIQIDSLYGVLTMQSPRR